MIPSTAPHKIIYNNDNNIYKVNNEGKNSCDLIDNYTQIQVINFFYYAISIMGTTTGFKKKDLDEFKSSLINITTKYLVKSENMNSPTRLKAVSLTMIH